MLIYDPSMYIRPIYRKYALISENPTTIKQVEDLEAVKNEAILL